MPAMDKWKIAFFVGLGAVVAGGCILTSLGFGVLRLHRPDVLNLILDDYAEIWIARIAGIAMMISPVFILPYVLRILDRKHSIKVAASRHVKRRAEEILSAIKALKTQSAKNVITAEQKKLLDEVETACLKLISSISAVVASDGDESGRPEFDRRVRETLR